MVDIQNATLAGGVAMGTCADLIIEPGFAMLIGCIAGWVSVYGFVHVQPYLEDKLGLDDTCGVNNLHGMPSIIGGFAGVIATSLATIDKYGVQMGVIMPARGDDGLGRTAQGQALQQLAYIFITIGIALSSGILTGLIVRHPIFDAPESKESFSDHKYWHVPELEMPYYFDHRGEITRGENSGLHGFALSKREPHFDMADHSSGNISALQVRLAKLEQMLMTSKTQDKLNRYPAEMEAKAASEKLASVFDHLIQRIDGVAAVSQLNMSRMASATCAVSTTSLFSNPPASGPPPAALNKSVSPPIRQPTPESIV